MNSGKSVVDNPGDQCTSILLRANTSHMSEQMMIGKGVKQDCCGDLLRKRARSETRNLARAVPNCMLWQLHSSSSSAQDKRRTVCAALTSAASRGIKRPAYVCDVSDWKQNGSCISRGSRWWRCIPLLKRSTLIRGITQNPAVENLRGGSGASGWHLKATWFCQLRMCMCLVAQKLEDENAIWT